MIICCRFQTLPSILLKISGTLSFGKTTSKLNTGDNLTLLSTINGTANVGQLTTENVITGNVTVDRYINTGAAGHQKSWQLLAVPTRGNGQTIRESWMEGATESNIPGAMGDNTPGSAGNPHGGYGTMTTSNVSGAGTFPLPGFDVYTSPGPSIKVYNPAY